MKSDKPSYEELVKKLAESEKLITRLAKNKKTTANGHNAPMQNSHELAEAYMASEQNFKNSMDASPLGIRIITEDGELIYANRAILEICGYNSAEEMAAVPHDELYTPESYKAHLERKRKRKLKEHVPLEYEISIRRPDHEVRHLQVFRRQVIWGGEQQFMAMYQDITEHKRAEEALKESEEKFHSIVEHSNDGILFIQEGKIQYCNTKMLDISGYSQKDILGRPFIDFVTPEHKEKVMDIYSKRVAGKKVLDRYELNIRGKAGNTVYTEVSASITKFKEIPLDIAIVRDITDRIKGQEALKESEEKFSKAFLASPDAVTITTFDEAIIIDTNEASVRNTGYTMEELIGHSIYELNLWVDLKERDRMHQLIEEKGRVVQEEYHIRKKGGEIRIWEFSAEPIIIGGKKCLISTQRDITEHKKAEEALASEAVRRRILIEQSRDGIVILDQPDGGVYEANQRFADMLGYTMDEVKKLHVFDWEFLYPTEQLLEMMRTVDEKGDHFETKHRRKDGTTYDVEISTNGAVFAGQKLIFCVCRDITERKMMEQAVKESEERFSKAFRASPAMVAITTIKDGRYIDINDSYVQGTGFSREELIGKTTSSMNIWANEQDRVNMFNSLKKQGRINKEEIDFRMKSGEIRTWLFSAEPITIGEEECLIGVSVDFTEYHRAEEALRESEARFRSLFETMAQGVVYQDAGGKIISANPAAERILGLSLKEMMGRTSGHSEWRSLHEDGSEFPGDQHPSMIALRSGKPVSNVVMGVYNSQLEEYRWILVSGIPEFRQGEKTPYRVYTTFTDITDRRKMQEDLEREGKEIKLIMDSSAALIWYKSKDGKFLRVNKAFADALNITPDDFVGKTVHDLYSPDIAKKMTEDDREVFTSERPKLNIIEQYESATGLRWVRTDKIPVQDKDGKTMAVIGFAQDITASKQAEKAIKESEEKFNKAFHASLNLMAIISLKEGRIIDVNEAYSAATGYTRKELIGNIALDKNLWANPEQRRGFYSIIAAEGRLTDTEIILRTKTGELRTFIFSAEKVTLGDTPCLVVSALDITGRKQAEERISYLNQTLRSIRNVNQLITREKDHDKLLQGVCDILVESRSFYTAWIALLDESSKLITHAVSGPSGSESAMVEGFKDGKVPPCVRKALKKTQVIVTDNPGTMCADCLIHKSTANFGSMTVRLEHDGNIYGVLCSSLPREILTDKNEVDLFQEVASDIAFALYNMDREAEYSRLEQERLRSAKLESIGTLAGGIAHDFNNLLTGIMGNIGLVKTRITPTDETFEMLDEAEKAALRARDLTQQLLTFARGGKPVKKPVNIAEVVKESATFALRGSKVSLKLALPDDLWSIEADEGQISQVINNLALNADEAMPSGGTLKITGENLTVKKTDIPLLTGSNYVRIDIADSGMGISDEHLQRIFEPYFTTKQRGSGLGLTSAYSIVKNHGGIILVDSTLNKGSTFHIYLPAVKKAVIGGKKMREKSSGQAGGKVLVMDDEEMIRKMLQNMLKLAGYTVEVSADGVEALKKYQHATQNGDPFDAVIMDLTIPGGMGGKEAAEKLLKIDPNALIIVSSGYATDSIMSEYKKYGFKAVIVKPYSVKTLQETLSGLLARKRK